MRIAPRSRRSADNRTARALRGGVVTLVGQLARITILFANLAVLGRLLSPTDFGLVALALALIGAAELLRDFGLAASAIQAEALPEEEATNLFWLNSGLGAILSLATLGVAWPLGWAFGDDRLSWVIAGLAPVFLLNGAGTQFQAHLARRGRFVALSTSDVAAQAAGLVVGVTLATHGADYWSLVGSQLATALVLLPLRAFFSGWMPQRPQPGTSVRHHVRFGVNLGLAQLLGYVANAAPTVALGA